jgi:mannose/cellobiose epimerase-like protein (N-acyl-D-glucosamine 2-epimerase family)
VGEVGRAELATAHQVLRSWLLEHAYDLWWRHGADHTRGGFHERLRLDATPTDEARRARLHPRQMFAYGLAAEIGWSGPAASAVEHALTYFIAHYRRQDGLYRSSVGPDGAPREERAVLYDQAFALLGFASAFDALADDRARTLARELHDVLHARLRHPTAGFEESAPRSLPLTANSHMHLFEASLAWRELDRDPRWARLAEKLADLALVRLIDARTGALHEFFTEDWDPVPGEPGRLIEPGHHFEWAGLLLRYGAGRPDAGLRAKALRLFEIAESAGVDRARGVVVDKLADDKSVAGGPARLWPQTERIKAASIAGEADADARWDRIALAATRTLLRYLETPVRGLWRDRMTADGTFVEEPAPASSFYHIVGAAAELGRHVRDQRLHKTNK